LLWRRWHVSHALDLHSADYSPVSMDNTMVHVEYARVMVSQHGKA
jgi:hypothetical protein